MSRSCVWAYLYCQARGHLAEPLFLATHSVESFSFTPHPCIFALVPGIPLDMIQIWSSECWSLMQPRNHAVIESLHTLYTARFWEIELSPPLNLQLVFQSQAYLRKEPTRKSIQPWECSCSRLSSQRQICPVPQAELLCWDSLPRQLGSSKMWSRFPFLADWCHLLCWSLGCSHAGCKF